MQVDESGPCGAVAHPFHQLSQISPGVSDQDVSGVTQVMQVNAGQPGLRDRRQPYALAEVAVMQRPGTRGSPGGRLLAAPYTKRASGRGGLPHVRWPASRPLQYPPQRRRRTCAGARPDRPSSSRPASCYRETSQSRAFTALTSLRDGAPRHPGVGPPPARSSAPIRRTGGASSSRSLLSQAA
jgi:hypothetical protein